jgi:hypothetical protein
MNDGKPACNIPITAAIREAADMRNRPPAEQERFMRQRHQLQSERPELFGPAGVRPLNGGEQ